LVKSYWIKIKLTFFAEVEQVAFSPGNLVPGIEATPDRVLLGRIFAYKDTQSHRIGINATQLPINCPLKGWVDNGQRDGPMAFISPENHPHYDSDSFGGPTSDPRYKEKPYKVEGLVERIDPKTVIDTNDFEQARLFWEKVLTPEKRKVLIHNMAGNLRLAKKEIQQRMIEIFTKVHPNYGKDLQDELKENRTMLTEKTELGSKVLAPIGSSH